MPGFRTGVPFAFVLPHCCVCVAAASLVINEQLQRIVLPSEHIEHLADNLYIALAVISRLNCFPFCLDLGSFVDLNFSFKQFHAGPPLFQYFI